MSKLLLVGDAGLHPTDAYSGMPGDGVTDERAALATFMATTMPAAGGRALLSMGTHVIGSALTITKKFVAAEGAILQPASGVALTIDADIDADGLTFDLSAGGTVAIGANGPREAHVEWWGATNGLTADNADAIQAAVNACTAAGVKLLALGVYRINSTILFGEANDGFSFTHADRMDITAAPSSGFVWGGAAGTDDNNQSVMIEMQEFQNATFGVLNLDNRVNATAYVCGLKFRNSDGTGKLGANNRFGRVSIAGCRLGVWIGDFTNDGYDSNIENFLIDELVFYDCDHLMLVDSNAIDAITITKFQGGGHPSGGVRDYLIRNLRNGGYFTIEHGGMRLDNLVTDAAAIQQTGNPISFTRKFWFEGATNPVRVIDIDKASGRDKCTVSGFIIGDGTRDSSGNVADLAYGSVCEINGWAATGNIVYGRELVASNITFQTGYDFVNSGGGSLTKSGPTFERVSSGAVSAKVTDDNEPIEGGSLLLSNFHNTFVKRATAGTVPSGSAYTICTVSVPNGDSFSLWIDFALWLGGNVTRNIIAAGRMLVVGTADTDGSLAASAALDANVVRADADGSYTAGHPTLAVAATVDAVADTVTVTITQTNNLGNSFNGIFRISAAVMDGNGLAYDSSRITV